MDTTNIFLEIQLNHELALLKYAENDEMKRQIKALYRNSLSDEERAKFDIEEQERLTHKIELLKKQNELLKREEVSDYSGMGW